MGATSAGVAGAAGVDVPAVAAVDVPGSAGVAGAAEPGGQHRRQHQPAAQRWVGVAAVDVAGAAGPARVAGVAGSAGVAGVELPAVAAVDVADVAAVHVPGSAGVAGARPARFRNRAVYAMEGDQHGDGCTPRCAGRQCLEAPRRVVSRATPASRLSSVKAP